MSTDIALPRQAGDISQATAVEQMRAVAEVRAAVMVAQETPRNMDRAVVQMQQACRTRALAERAFYRVPNRGSGPSVHLARELARCFGNVQHGITELRRDDLAGISEMQAFAWDVENNTRSTRSFIVPHARMANKKRQALTDLNDIINNNNNAGARAVRETIFTVLPVWFIEDAKALCQKALQDGDGTPLKERVRNMVAAYGRASITEAQLATKVDGRMSSDWDEEDVATLTVLFQALKTGETTKAEEFPAETQRVTADELTGEPAAEYDPTQDPSWGQR